MHGKNGCKNSTDNGVYYTTVSNTGFKNGDVITVIKEGKHIKFMKNSQDLGVAFNDVTSDDLFFPAMEFYDAKSSFTILSE